MGAAIPPVLSGLSGSWFGLSTAPAANTVVAVNAAGTAVAHRVAGFLDMAQTWVQPQTFAGGVTSPLLSFGADKGRIVSPSLNNITLLNYTSDGFDLLQFGGTTDQFPALTGATGVAGLLRVWLADDSGYGAIYTGGFGTRLRSVAANYVVTPTDHTILVNATGGNRVIEVPPCDENKDSHFLVKKTDSSVNTVTVQDPDAAVLATLRYQNQTVLLHASTSAWVTIFDSDLNGLADVTISSVASGNVLYHNGANFINAPPDAANLVAKTGTQTIAGAKTFSEAVGLATSTGNVGVGTTDVEAWHASYGAIEFPFSSLFFGKTAGDKATALVGNAYFDGGWKYKSTGPAAEYVIGNGEHMLRVAASGSADAAITWTTAVSVANNSAVIFSGPSATFAGNIKALDVVGSAGSLFSSRYFTDFANTVAFIDTDTDSTHAWMLTNRTASKTPFTLQGAASQSANLFELQNSGGTVLASFGALGALTGTSAMFSEPVRVGNYTVATLPTAGSGTKGRHAYATDGRVGAEGVGAGTGTAVVDAGAAWKRVEDWSTVAA